MVEHSTEDRKVPGSIPGGVRLFFDFFGLIDRHRMVLPVWKGIRTLAGCSQIYDIRQKPSIFVQSLRLAALACRYVTLGLEWPKFRPRLCRMREPVPQELLDGSSSLLT